MASIIKIKRSETGGNPATLGTGELAYSSLAGTEVNGGDRLYIGIGTETAGNAASRHIIGGKYFTDMLDHTRGTLVNESALITNATGELQEFKVDDFYLNDNIIRMQNRGGNAAASIDLVITPLNEGVIRYLTDGSAGVSYEQLITTLNDGDAIPNKQYVDDAVASSTSLVVRDEALAEQAVDLVNDVFFVTGGEGIDTVVTRTLNGEGAGQDTVTLTLSGEDATSANKGIASFDATDFTVTTGNVVANAITLGTSALNLGETTTSLTGLQSIAIDNVTIDGNTISTTDVNGNLILLPNGAGVVVIDSLEFDGSTITATPTNTDLTLAATGTGVVVIDDLSIDGNTITATTLNSDINLVADGTGSVIIDELALAGSSIVAAGAAADINIILQPKGTGSVDVANDGATESRIVNVADPIDPTDAANRRYVDEVAQGLTVRPAVRAGTTVNLASTYDNGILGEGATLTSTINVAFPLIDDVGDATPSAGGFTDQTDRVWAIGDLVLVKDQTNAGENGIYEITDVGSAGTPWILTRHPYVDSAAEIPSSYTFVQEGTTQAGTGWTALVDDFNAYDVGTDDIVWYQFSGAGAITEGDGINIVGNTLSVDIDATGTGLTFVAGVTGNSLSVNPLIAGNGLTYDATGTGILNVAGVTVPQGGTGLTTVTANQIMYGNGVGALGVTTASLTDGSFLRSDTGGVPTWSNTIDGGTY